MSSNLKKDIVLAEGRRVITLESEALGQLAQRLDQSFFDAVVALIECEGRVITSGMGKAGLIAQKVAATFASLGKAAFFMHPAEAAHGDLGMITRADCVLIFSHSGESDEISALLKPIQTLGSKIVAITATTTSVLAKNSNIVITMGKITEAGLLGLAPTTSTTVMLALGDALAMGYLYCTPDFDERSFAFYHPGGSLGKRYTPVSKMMRTGEEVVVVAEETSIQEVIIKMTQTKSGSAIVCDSNREVIGIFSDGDLRRAINKQEGILYAKVATYMSRNPTLISNQETVAKAIEIMRSYKIGEIPVVDKQRHFLGVLSLKDVA